MTNAVQKTAISLLQELCAQQGMTPDYKLMSVEGELHAPTFMYRVQVNEVVATATGQNKKKAKHAAAKAILKRLIAKEGEYNEGFQFNGVTVNAKTRNEVTSFLKMADADDDWGVLAELQFLEMRKDIGQNHSSSIVFGNLAVPKNTSLAEHAKTSPSSPALNNQVIPKNTCLVELAKKRPTSPVVINQAVPKNNSFSELANTRPNSLAVINQAVPNSNGLAELTSTHPNSSTVSNQTVPKKRLSDLIKTNENTNEEDEDGLSAAEYSLLRKVLRTRLLETSAVVEIRRRNDNSPLHSVKSFEQLNIPQNLLRGVYAMGFNTPSKIQETALPTLMANPPVNMIAQAQSGTGKTAAFLLASLTRINTQEEHPQVLILSPTYELALQTGDVARQMAQFCTDITFRFTVRGEMLERNHIIKEHVLIGTPGKVFDWVRRYNYFDIKKIRVFVFDEADVMISTQGHHDQCIRIHSMVSRDCQILLFSATYTAEVMKFAEQIVHDPVIIRLRREEETLDNVQQYYIPCPTPDDKYKALQNIYGAVSIGQTIIFCRTKRTAVWLGSKLTEDGHSVGYLSGDLTVHERKNVINSFREGKEKVMITTNVCARGIDIEQVTLVINFDLPVFMNGHADCETYLHRIGRTGRFGKSGIAVNLISGEQDELVMKEIETHFGKSILHINANSSDDLEKLY